MKLSVLIAFVAVLLASCTQPEDQAEPFSNQAPQTVDIITHDISLSVQPGNATVKGVQRIELWIPANHTELRFDMGEISITRLRLAGQEVTDWHYADGTLKIPLPEDLEKHKPVILEARYAVEPKRGFLTNPKIIYASYFACDWMICNQEDFNDRAEITLRLIASTGLTSVGPGMLVDISPGEDGNQIHTWKTQGSFPAYIYAFAIGDFIKHTDETCSRPIITLSFRSPSAMRELFSTSCEMLEFFEAKAGVPSGSTPYYQLLTEDSGAAQEAVSHATLGTRVVLPLLEDRTEDWAIAHEMAHQWWGNRITAEDLSQFWLNEGIVTYMVAAWKQSKWGDDKYEREIDLAKKRWGAWKERWQDVPLTYSGEFPSLSARRATQYSKAAVFLHVLREEIGDEAFWAGLRAYSTKNMGRSVNSIDFQQAMQNSSDKDISLLFEEWVYQGKA